MQKEQIKIFVMSYIINILSLLGLTEEFMTATFFDENDSVDKKNFHISLPEI